MKKVVWLLITMVMAIGLVFSSYGCAQQPPASVSTPIKIGAILEMTGPVARWGPMHKAGLELRFEQAGWKVAGRTIQLIVEDGASSMSVSNDKAKKLIEMDKVNIMVGPLNNDITAGLAPYFSQTKVPDIGVAQAPPELKQYEWIFTPPGPVEECGYYAGMYAAEKLGYKTATVIGADFVTGYKIVDAFSIGFKEKGGKIAGSAGWPPIGTVDYGPYLAALKDANVAAGWLVPGSLFVKQYYEFGLWKKMPLMEIYTHEITEIDLQELGNSAKGVVGAALYNLRTDTPENKKFVADFQKKYNSIPSEWEMLGYDAASIALAALEATGGDTTPEKLRKAIQDVKINLPSGPFSFTSSRFGIRNIYMVKADTIDGKLGWKILDKFVTDPDKLPVASSTK